MSASTQMLKEQQLAYEGKCIELADARRIIEARDQTIREQAMELTFLRRPIPGNWRHAIEASMRRMPPLIYCDQHPPSRHCMCVHCAPSFPDDAQDSGTAVRGIKWTDADIEELNAILAEYPPEPKAQSEQTRLRELLFPASKLWSSD